MPFAKITLELPVDLSDTEASENVVDALGEFLKAAHVRGARTDLRVPADTRVPARDPPAEDDPLLGGGGEPGPDQNPEPAATGPKRVRDRTAERRAKREREAAEAAEAARKTGARTKPNGAVNPTPPPDDDPLMGAPDGDPGHADPFDTPIPPADAPPGGTRTPQQLMDASIIILRQCYGAAGGVEQVKVIQKEFKVQQFTQVPLDKAVVLYNRALALANTLSVKLPAGV